MLKRIRDLDIDDAQKLAAIFRGWVALCTETGAQLSVSHGRTQAGDTKYILILPNKPVDERGGLFAPYDWDYPNGRKFIRAWSDAEAIELANAKLAKMIGEEKRWTTKNLYQPMNSAKK